MTSREEEESILRTVEIPNKSEISLQMIIDNFIPQLTTNMDTKCSECTEECEETNTLMLPPPMIMIHINKAKSNLVKTNMEIIVDDVINVPTTENPGGEKYAVTDVISHLGSNTSNGHYITTHFHEGKKTWESINDHECTAISIKDAEDINKHGVVYVMKRLQEGDSTAENNSEQLIPTDYHNQYPEISNSCDSGINGRYQQNGIEKPSDEDGYTLKKRKERKKKRENPWEMVPKENPWSRITSTGEVMSNKRYYIDRDEPSDDKKICWWHLRNRCKFGKTCFWSHSKQPFRNGAQ